MAVEEKGKKVAAVERLLRNIRENAADAMDRVAMDPVQVIARCDDIEALAQRIRQRLETPDA